MKKRRIPPTPRVNALVSRPAPSHRTLAAASNRPGAAKFGAERRVRPVGSDHDWRHALTAVKFVHDRQQLLPSTYSVPTVRKLV